jgi:phosphopantetheinyl transferase (holo-ACP synthase)
VVLLHGSARAMVGARRVDVTLSHTAHYAVAVVVVEESPGS